MTLDDDEAKALLQTFFFVTNKRALDGCTHTDRHTSPLSLVQSPAGASQRLFVGCPPAVLVSAAVA